MIPSPVEILELEGLCECGCGQRTTIAAKNIRRWGHIKGRPVRFVPGHNLTPRGGSKHPSWKGDKPGYWAVHAWMARTYPRHGICLFCNRRKKTHWANLDHEYRRAQEDWAELCVSCHKRYDDKKFGRPKRPHLYKSHCKNGHAMDEENTRINRNGTRACRACERERHRRKASAA